jgi:pimeloyl-ACP methyl ester carboxylesterase
MAQVKANGITIEYETFGAPRQRPLILVMGLSTQMVAWPDRFCAMLADAGHFVVRFDNRDVGLSTKLEALGVPDLNRLMANGGADAVPPYTLSDMAADTVGLMDGLGLKRAHVCGLSMGGMIAQIMAVEWPERIAGLISLSSTTGEPDLPGSAPEAVEAMMSKPPVGKAAYVDYQAQVYRAFSGDSPFYQEAVQRELSGRAYDRMFYPNGFARQMAAIICAPGRRSALATASAPALVIHGDRDTVVPPAHGRDTADAISGATLKIVKGLGHGMAYPALWEEIVSAVSTHTEAGGR